MGAPVVTVPSGGAPVVVVPTGGTPVVEALNKYGRAVTVAANGYGLPVTFTGTVDPETLGTMAARYTAYDTTYLTVNNDGTGGAPVDGGPVGRWADRSGNNKHLTAVAATRPVYRAGKGVNFWWTIPDTRASMSNTTMSINRNACSGGALVELPGQLVTCIVSMDLASPTNALAIAAGQDAIPGNIYLVYMYGGAVISTNTLVTTSRRSVITWRSNASNFIIRCNGVEFTVAGAANLVMTQLLLGRSAGGGNKPIRQYEHIVYSQDIGDTKIRQLEDYLRSRAGALSTTHTVVIYGDSMGEGVGSATNTPWHDTQHVTDRINSTWYAFNADGYFLFVQHVTAAQINALKGTTEGVVVIWAGTNDIIGAGKTGAQTEASMAAFAGALKAGGNKVVVATLQHFVTNNAERINFNTLLKANYTSYADAIVLLDEAPALSNALNTTYYTSDGVHLKDAGHAVAGALFQTALANLGVPDTTAPTITSSSTVSNAEGAVLAHALTADELVAWAIVAGGDGARFEISGSTLRWLANGVKDFEVPDDADANNTYVVTVRATDTASLTATQTITVTVTDVAVEGGGAGIVNRAGAPVLDRAGAAINAR